MAISKTSLAYILSTCLLIQCLVSPIMSAPPPGNQMQLEHRQTPLSPSQFALAATRFIVMLPFLPLMMAVPGVTAVVMPLFMALQDRLTTMIPNLPNMMGNNNNNNNNNASPQGGVVTNLISAFGGSGGGGSSASTNPVAAQPSSGGAFANIFKALGIRRPGNSNQNQQGSPAVAETIEAVSEVPTFFRFKRSLLKMPSKELNEGLSQVLDFLSKTVDVFDSNHKTEGDVASSKSATGFSDSKSINEEIREAFDFLYTSALGFNNPNGSLGDSVSEEDRSNSTLALTEGFRDVFDFLQNMNISLSDDDEEKNTEGQQSTINSDDEKVPQHLRFKRTLLKLPTKALNEGFREVFSFLHKTDDVLNQLTSGQPDCRRQAVCRFHHSFDPTIGSFLGNVIQVFRLESKVEKLDVSETARSILKDVLKAANTGLYGKDCNSVYSRCSITVRARGF